MFTGTPIITDWVKPGSEVVSSQSVVEVEGGFIRVATYDIGKAGRVIHLVPSIGVNGGADEIFLRYQSGEIPFRRYRMYNGKGIPNWCTLICS